MSGLGPAACWLAHKRIESWSRLAKERVGAVRKSTDKNDDKSASNSPRTSMSVDSNNDSFASSEVILFSSMSNLKKCLLLLSFRFKGNQQCSYSTWISLVFRIFYDYCN